MKRLVQSVAKLDCIQKRHEPLFADARSCPDRPAKYDSGWRAGEMTVHDLPGWPTNIGTAEVEYPLGLTLLTVRPDNKSAAAPNRNRGASVSRKYRKSLKEWLPGQDSNLRPTG